MPVWIAQSERKRSAVRGAAADRLATEARHGVHRLPYGRTLRRLADPRTRLRLMKVQPAGRPSFLACPDMAPRARSALSIAFSSKGAIFLSYYQFGRYYDRKRRQIPCALQGPGVCVTDCRSLKAGAGEPTAGLAPIGATIFAHLLSRPCQIPAAVGCSVNGEDTGLGANQRTKDRYRVIRPEPIFSTFPSRINPLTAS